MDCEICNGVGYTAVRNGDDDVTCKACKGAGVVTIQNAALAQGDVEIVLFYTQRYKHARHIVMPDLSFVYQVEMAANTIWYKLGLYDKYNHDYFHYTYKQLDDEWGTLEQSMGADIERGNEQVYSNREMW